MLHTSCDHLPCGVCCALHDLLGFARSSLYILNLSHTNTHINTLLLRELWPSYCNWISFWATTQDAPGLWFTWGSFYLTVIWPAFYTMILSVMIKTLKTRRITLNNKASQGHVSYHLSMVNQRDTLALSIIDQQHRVWVPVPASQPFDCTG